MPGESGSKDTPVEPGGNAQDDPDVQTGPAKNGAEDCSGNKIVLLAAWTAQRLRRSQALARPSDSRGFETLSQQRDCCERGVVKYVPPNVIPYLKDSFCEFSLF